MKIIVSRLLVLFLAAPVLFSTLTAEAEELKLRLRTQVETSPDSGRYHRLIREETWKPSETALIVCDMWDLHHCLNAVRRGAEFAPRLDKLLSTARKQGMTIIHAPSSCMKPYENNPARKRAQNAPAVAVLPKEIQKWCYQIPSEEKGIYPIDQKDGGEDDDPEEHANWARELAAKGLNPRSPWTKQTEMLTIDPAHDYISDQGDEIWNVLEQKGIKNVILTGVHTNMCVLGRPFGLRQMARNGKNVVLMRDLTDTMYNPASWPYVSHFTGTDLIVSHIEKFVCPTITSDQLISGKEFRFKNDKRPHLVVLCAEAEYETAQTLPKFMLEQLGKEFQVSYVFASDKDRNQLPGLEVIKDADLLLVSVRRRVLPAADLKMIRDYVKSGKPVVGIRTASHAFHLRNEKLPKGHAEWPEFDAQVFGGNYHNHYGNKLKSQVMFKTESSHEILKGISTQPFQQGGSLYKTAPLAKGTTILATGAIEGHPAEPVAWTFKRADGGKSFYTSLGQVKDFKNPQFLRLLVNGIHWAAGIPAPKQIAKPTE